jgi:hypothetical protein
MPRADAEYWRYADRPGQKTTEIHLFSSKSQFFGPSCWPQSSAVSPTYVLKIHNIFLVQYNQQYTVYKSLISFEKLVSFSVVN